MQMDMRPHNMSYAGIYHHPQSSMYGTTDDPLLARAEAAAMSDISKTSGYPHHFGYLGKHDSLYGQSDLSSMHNNNNRQLSLHGFGAPPGESMLEQLSQVSMPLSGFTPEHSGGLSISAASQVHSAQMYNSHYGGIHHSNPHVSSGMIPSSERVSQSCGSGTGGGNGHMMCSPHSGLAMAMSGDISPHVMSHGGGAQHHDLECDPRELEAFAEHFKQRRIKLGVTQADVGSALGKLKIPGVGSLSQSTICRFESLTLSHNNMIALKPVLQTWLEDAEAAAREARAHEESLAANEKKKKRTSITAAEKRSLEAYFAIQPRPSGEKISQIAEKLGLKKSVVRVWFCNQRQKQKRMKFSSVTMQGPQVSLGR